MPFAFGGFIEGLCGNCNQNKSDDFMCNDGTVFPMIEGKGHSRTTSEWETAKCWKINGTDGPSPNDINGEQECDQRIGLFCSN